MPELMAEETTQEAPVVQAQDNCADIVKAKEICLAEGGDCTELMKSFEECMNKNQS